MLYIPPTNPDYYVSSIVALNVISPENTGDWHSAAALSSNAYPPEIDDTQRLNEMGYYPEHTPVWMAVPKSVRGLSL